MSNVDQCHHNINACYQYGMSILDNIAIELTDEESNDIQEYTGILELQLDEMETESRSEYARSIDTQLESLQVKSKNLKNSINVHNNVAKVISILESAVSIATRIIMAISTPMAPLARRLSGERSLFSGAESLFTERTATAKMSDWPVFSHHVDGENSDNLKAERDFLRCMVSYLLHKPIMPNAWMNCRGDFPMSTSAEPAEAADLPAAPTPDSGENTRDTPSRE